MIPKNDVHRGKSPKILLWDLETSHLNANGGFIICASIVEASKPDKVHKRYRVDDYPGWKKDPWNDRDLVRDLVAELGTADTWVTYYGKRFDAPYLATRILYWRARGFNIPHLENVPHIDLYDTAKRRLRLHSNRLQVVSDLLGNGEKTPLELPVWLKAAGGHKKSIDYVAKHCDEDAKILARNYIALRPLVIAHPHLGLLQGSGKESCPACGGTKVQSRGVYVTQATKRRRLFCGNCGKWSSVPYSLEKSNREINRRKMVQGKVTRKGGKNGGANTRTPKIS